MDRPLSPSPVRSLRPLLVSVGVLALVGAAVAGWMVLPKSGATLIEDSEVSTAVATIADVEDSVPLRIRVEPGRATAITSAQTGQIRELLVQVGSAVRAGQPIIMLSNPDFELAVEARRTELLREIGELRLRLSAYDQEIIEVETVLDEQIFALEEARRNRDRQKILFDRGFLSAEGFDMSQRKVLEAEARVGRARETLASARRIAAGSRESVAQSIALLEEQLVRVSAQISALVVRAPAAGVVASLDVVPGAAVAAGAQIGRVEDLGTVRLLAWVEEFYLPKVSSGLEGQATIGTTKLPVAVLQVLPQVRDGRFEIELGFQGAQSPELRSGQTLDGTLTLGRSEAVITLPNGPWVSSGGGRTVYVVSPDGRSATRSPVTLGMRSPSTVEVRSGLQAGQTVLVSVPDGARDAPVITLR